MVAVGASFVVGAPVLDSPALCLDSPPITSMSLRSGGDLVLRRKSKAKNRLAMPGSTLDLRSSFVNSGGEWRLSAGAVGHRSRRNQRRNRRLVIANEFAGQYEDSFDDVKMVQTSMFTNNVRPLAEVKKPWEKFFKNKSLDGEEDGWNSMFFQELLPQRLSVY